VQGVKMEGFLSLVLILPPFLLITVAGNSTGHILDAIIKLAVIKD
jgi:hypothetical protein